MMGLKIHTEEFKIGDFELNAIDVELPKGCVLGLIGENGAGKTTLINLITKKISTGKEWVHFEGIADYREDMAFILDANPYPNSFKVKDVGKLMSYAYKNWEQAKFDDLCDAYGLNKQDKVKKLSLGMSQRLMQAAALSHHAKLFVFDEPNDGIDPFIRTELLNDLRNAVYTDEITAVISSHNTEELESIIDYVAYMEKGRLLLFEDIESFRDHAVKNLKNFGCSAEGIRKYEQDPSLTAFTTMMQTERRHD